MDVSGLIVVPLAALITAGWLISAAMLSKRDPGFRPPFLLSYVLGVLFMEPWHVGSPQHLGIFAVMLIMLLFSTAAGCLIVGLPAALIVSLASKLRQRSNG